MKNSTPWTLIDQSLGKRVKVMLLYVLESRAAALAARDFLWQ